MFPIGKWLISLGFSECLWTVGILGMDAAQAAGPIRIPPMDEPHTSYGRLAYSAWMRRKCPASVSMDGWHTCREVDGATTSKPPSSGKSMAALL